MEKETIMQSTDSRAEKTEDTRSRIFTVAARLMAHKGYFAVSMREISEQSGVTKPTIYYHFQSKEELYRQLLDTAIHHGDVLINDIINKESSVQQKLADMLKVRFRFSLEYPDLARFFVHLFTHLEDNPLSEKLLKEADVRRKMLKDLIRNGIKSGEFGMSLKPEIAVEIFLGTAAHFISQQLAGRKIVLTDKLAEEIVEVLFKGLNE